jgi:hypothetical protein
LAVVLPPPPEEEACGLLRPPGVEVIGRGVVPVTPRGAGVEVVPAPPPPGPEEVVVVLEVVDCWCCFWAARRRVRIEVSSVRASTASGERPAGRCVAIVVVEGGFRVGVFEESCRRSGSGCKQRANGSVWGMLVGGFADKVGCRD